MSDVSLPHRVHLLEQKLALLDKIIEAIPVTKQEVEPEVVQRLVKLENQYRMLNARVARKSSG